MFATRLDFAVAQAQNIQAVHVDLQVDGAGLLCSCKGFSAKERTCFREAILARHAAFCRRSHGTEGAAHLRAAPAAALGRNHGPCMHAETPLDPVAAECSVDTAGMR